MVGLPESPAATNGKKRRRRRPSNAPVRLADVARSAGVSTGSVSRALNEPDKVSDETRARVQAAVEELGWVPSGAARMLASHKTRTIGAIIPTLANVIFAEVMNTIQHRLMSEGFTLIIGCSEYDRDQAYLQGRTLIERGVDGLILLGEDFTEPFWTLLEVHRKPYVITYNFRAQSTRPCVGCDNYDAFSRLTQHLIDFGHRRFAIIAQDGSNNDRALARLQGAVDTLERSGLHVRPEHLVIKSWSIGKGREGMREILAHPPWPTAVLCINDHLAIGAIDECQAAGLRVPQDISVAGFDDMEFSSYIHPPLTTVHIPTELLGEKTAEHLLATLNGTPVLARQQLAAELVVRKSTGPARE